MTKQQYRAILASERAAFKAEQAAMIPNPNYRKRLSYSEIFNGVSKGPRFIPPPAATD